MSAKDKNATPGASSMTPPIRMVSVPYPLWMMHVIGPDDIYPAPDHATAVEWCAYLNQEIAPTVPGVLCVAVPAIWTGTAEEHAEGLPEAVKGWTQPLTAAPVREEGGAEKAREIASSAAEAFQRLMVSTKFDRETRELWAGAYNDMVAIYSALATCKTCGGKGYTEHEGGEGEGHPSRPEIEACACHEEAPAEAGLRSGDTVEFRAHPDDPSREIAHVVRAQPQAREEAQPDTDCVSLLADLDAGKPCGAEAAAVIRQLIKDREEAQPVAWARRWFIDGEEPRKERNAKGRMAWPKKFIFHKVTEARVMKDDVALFTTPPAPEAEKLRVAVEAMRGALEWDKGTGYRMPYRVRDPLYAAIDLAALQQEGR